MRWNDDDSIKIRHFYNDSNNLVATLITKLHYTESEKVFYGISVVCPQDSGNKTMGRTVAYNRCLKAIEESVDDPTFTFVPFKRPTNSLFDQTSQFIIGKYGITGLSNIKEVIALYKKFRGIGVANG